MTSAPCGLDSALRARFAAAPLRIGTDTSDTAEYQAGHVVHLLTSLLPRQVGVEIVPVGGTVDRALITYEIDMAVHALGGESDIPLVAGTAFGAYLPCEDMPPADRPRSGIGIQARTADAAVMQLLHHLNGHPAPKGAESQSGSASASAFRPPPSMTTEPPGET